MTRNQIQIGFLSAFALVATLIASRPAAAQDAKDPYPKMAPIEQYLMDRDAEIALARSAAPEAISHEASVIVLTRHGYETAVQGKNGWVCWVGRGWMAMFDHPEFWSPKVRAADCLNPPGARSVLPYAYKRTELILAGRSKQEVVVAIKAAIEKKELPALEQDSVSYMMSKSSYLTDSGGHNMPHLMFFQGDKPAAAWGANVANSPVLAVNYWYISPDAYPQLKSFPPLSIFLVGVDKWSDGTPGPPCKATGKRFAPWPENRPASGRRPDGTKGGAAESKNARKGDSWKQYNRQQNSHYTAHRGKTNRVSFPSSLSSNCKSSFLPALLSPKF